MARLFAADDLGFLQEQAGYRRGMDRRLRLARKRALRSYLAQIRSDFLTMHDYCRLLARKSRNWELALLAQRQLIVFYGLFSALHLRCVLGSFTYVHVDSRDLVAAMRRLQRGVRTAAESVEPKVAVSASSIAD